MATLQFIAVRICQAFGFCCFNFIFPSMFFFWFDERFAYSYSRRSVCMCERVHLVFMDSGHLCCLLKMYIFHFVSIDSEPVLIQLVILMIAHLILIKFVSFFPLFCGGYRLKCKGDNTSDLQPIPVYSKNRLKKTQNPKHFSCTSKIVIATQRLSSHQNTFDRFLE